MSDKLRFRASDLRGYVERFLRHFDVPAEDARIMADVLITADERGVDSHGIIRLHSYYGTRLRRQLIDPTSPMQILEDAPAVQVIDAGNGLGPVVAHRAMRTCIAKAETTSLATVTVRNSNHYGIAGYYAMMALSHDMIGISLTNSQPLVAPTYGRTSMLGTNPIAVAVPAGRERAYVLDMATSVVPVGRITVYSKSHQPIPSGWGMDAEGHIVENPDRVLDGGALLPLGGADITRGYKGYGLALLVDILSGVLAGAAFGPAVGRPESTGTANVGHFFLALRIGAFRSLASFKEDMDRLLAELKDSPKAEGQDRIYIHGEKEYEQTERSAVEGVPVLSNVVDSLKAIGDEIGVPFDCRPIQHGS